MCRVLVMSVALAVAMDIGIVRNSDGQPAPLLDPLRFAGDLDGDGWTDVALVVRHPERAVSVVVFERERGGWVHAHSVRLEEGARVDRLRIVPGRLTVAYRRPYPVDPPGRPSRETVRSFALVEGRLHGGDHRLPDGAWEKRIAAALDAGPIEGKAAP